jgi:protein phosphatase
VRYAASSDIGKVREQNEDAWNIILGKAGHPVGFVVADGMGGHEAGEVASRMAVEIMSETVESCSTLGMNLDDAEVFLRDGMDEANRRIIQYSQENLRGISSGTTLTAAFLDGPIMLLIHIGDSRAYLFRDKMVKQISRDHTYVAELVASGVIEADAAKVHPERNKITRALGFDMGMRPEVFWGRVRDDDQMLFCTDGLSEYVTESEMAELLSRCEPEQAVASLVSMANDRGGRDNITVIVVAMEPGDTP